MNTNIILAADLPDLSKLKILLQLPIQGVKVGPILGLTYGLFDIIELIQVVNPKLNIIWDGQKLGSDIPQMMGPFIEVIKIAGIEETILFPLAGLDTLEAAIEACNKLHIKPWIGLAMSHEGFDLGHGGFISEDTFFENTRTFVKTNYPQINSFVVPCTKSHLLDKITEPCEIMITGITQKGNDISSINRLSQRINTEGSININIILGSALYNSDEPEKVIDNIKFL